MKKLLYASLAVLMLLGCKPKENPVEPQEEILGGIGVKPQASEWDGTKRADITYQLLIYSFADSGTDALGDLKGVEEHLDYIDALGANGIWLSPVHPCSSYHGYDVMDYEGVNPNFGTEADLQSLIDKAHEKGISIYLDFVLNHTSSNHPWFNDAKASESSHYRDWYIFSKDPQADIRAGKIAMISTEGSGGYDAGQWYSTSSDAGYTGRLHFDLDWSNSSSPKVTVTETTAAPDADNTDAGVQKWLYYGDGQCKRFYDKGGNKYELTVDFVSDWGFLIRTSNTDWGNGYKWGASSNTALVQFGTPYTLTGRTSSFDPINLQFSAPYMYHSHFWTGAFADLNYGPAESCEQSGPFKAVCAAADKFINMGVDGLRLDAVKHIYHNAGSNENPTFLKKFYDHCNATYKARGGQGEFFMVGEMYDEANLAAPYFAGLPSCFEFSFWYRLEWAINNGTGRYFVKDINSYRDMYARYRSDYIESTKLTNHDENRAASCFSKYLPKEKLAACVLLTSTGAPFIYQGEELGYWGKKDNGDEYVRTPIMWNADGTHLAKKALNGKIDNAMLTEEISVERQAADEESLLNVYRNFAKLRNTYPALAQGEMIYHPVYNQDNADFNNLAVWYRTLGDSKVLVVHNFSGKTVTAPFEDDLTQPIARNGEVAYDKNNARILILGAYSTVVFAL